MSDLGGIYGDLLFSGGWSPLAARGDMESFITENSTTGMTDLMAWFWKDDDDLSFRAASSLPTKKERNDFKFDSHETCIRLPFVWEAYCDFCDKIDKAEFKAIVSEIYKAKKKKINKKQIQAYAKRIIL